MKNDKTYKDLQEDIKDFKHYLDLKNQEVKELKSKVEAFIKSEVELLYRLEILENKFDGSSASLGLMTKSRRDLQIKLRYLVQAGILDKNLNLIKDNVSLAS